MKKKLFSLFLAICMILSLVPVTVFAADAGKLTFTCQSNAGNGGQIWYQLNCTGDFEKATTTASGDGYEPISLTSESGDVSSIAIKLVPNEGFKLDTTRGVKLSVNGSEKFNQSGESIADFTTESGHTFDLTEWLGGSTVAASTFELEFGFENDEQQDPQPAENEDNFRFTCQGDPNGGTISYKIGTSGEFTVLNYSEGNTIKLGDTDTSITVKIEPDTANGYLLDTDRGVILRVDGEDKFTARGDEISDFATGHTFNLSSYIAQDGNISESNFELEFEIKNQNGGGSGFKPYEGQYSGTPVTDVPLKVSGNIDFCINDSELYNISGENEMNLTGDYTYDGSGYVDFYVQWRLDNRYTSIIINGTDYYSQLPTPDTPEGRQALIDACIGQLNEFKLTVPYSKDGYVISANIKELDDSDKNYMQVGNFLWRYYTSENEDDLIENGKMELVNVAYGGNTYTKEQLTNEASAFHWTEDDNGGEAVLPAGAEVTVKIVPDAGYQLTEFELNGNPFTTGEEPSVFTFEIAQGNFHLGAKITQVGDEVRSGTDTVKSGKVLFLVSSALYFSLSTYCGFAVVVAPVQH